MNENPQIKLNIEVLRPLDMVENFVKGTFWSDVVLY